MTQTQLRRIFKKHYGESAELARRLSLNRTTISRWLRGQVISSRIAAAALSRAAELLDAERIRERPIDPARPEISPVKGTAAAVEEHASLGYGALSHALVDYWMAKMSGAEFKLAVLFTRHTIGEVDKRLQGDMEIAISLDEIMERAGVDRESAVRAIRELEGKGVASAQRAHRTTTVYTLDLKALLAPLGRAA